MLGDYGLIVMGQSILYINTNPTSALLPALETQLAFLRALFFSLIPPPKNKGSMSQ